MHGVIQQCLCEHGEAVKIINWMNTIFNLWFIPRGKHLETQEQIPKGQGKNTIHLPFSNHNSRACLASMIQIALISIFVSNSK